MEVFLAIVCFYLYCRVSTLDSHIDDLSEEIDELQELLAKHAIRTD